MDKPIDLLRTEPALAWKLAVNILGKSEDSPDAHSARAEVREALLVKALIGTCDRSRSAYKKWDGAHWVLSILGDLGYPAGDEALRPLMEDTFNTWMSKKHETKHLQVIDGRVRRCASQEGYAIWCSLRLGFGDSDESENVVIASCAVVEIGPKVTSLPAHNTPLRRYHGCCSTEASASNTEVTWPCTRGACCTLPQAPVSDSPRSNSND